MKVRMVYEIDAGTQNKAEWLVDEIKRGIGLNLELEWKFGTEKFPAEIIKIESEQPAVKATTGE